jgi:ribosome-binding factor A
VPTAELVERFFGDGGSDRASRSSDRKQKQLAREAYRVLSHALGALADRRLATAVVVEVRPAAGGLIVQVSAGQARVSEAQAALDRAAGELRDELAASLARKRVPDLWFEVVP